MKKNNMTFVFPRQRHYVHEAVLHSGPGKNVYKDRQDEIARLEGEIQRLTIERNLLRKTAVYFSRPL